MGILGKVKSGLQERAYIHFLYGPNGSGKSTWASRFPKPLFADLERGSFHLDVDRVDDITTLEQFKELTTELLSSPTKYQTFVVDSVESLESLIHGSIKKRHKVESIEDVPYGRGYTESREIMNELMDQFRRLSEEKSITVILIGHSQIKTHNDPNLNVSYDRFIPRTADKMAAVICDKADNVFFATYEVHTKTDGSNKAKAFSEGNRKMFTQWRAGFTAKSRMALPFELPLDYDAFLAATQVTSGVKADVVIEDIKRMQSLVTDSKIQTGVERALKEAGHDLEKLIVIKQRLSNVTKGASHAQ